MPPTPPARHSPHPSGLNSALEPDRPGSARRHQALTIALAILLAATPAAAATLRLLAGSAAGSIDTQVNYTQQYWQVFTATHDGLLAFRKQPGDAGRTLVPDLASAMPDLLPGPTYRFHLRPGIRFSNGHPVQPQDVVASFRRIFRVGSPTARTYYGAIDGAEACLAAPTFCVLPGVRSDGDTITITLTRPDPQFLQALALPHAAILPADTPPRDSGTIPLPGTGPYRIASYDPGSALVLDRNPYFKPWNEEAQPPGRPDLIHYDFGLEPQAQVTAVLRGDADWMFDAPPPDRLPEIARDHRAQLHLTPAPALFYLALNTRRLPFADPSIRRALAMAIDRRAAIRLFGGSALATPLCLPIPPNVPDYDPACPIPFDPATARAIITHSAASETPVTLVVDSSPLGTVLGPWLMEALTNIGLRPTLKTLSPNTQFTYIQNSANDVDISLTSWYADFPSATAILAGNFGCDAFHPSSDASTNISGYCDPDLDARLAAGDVAAVNRVLGNAAPGIPLFAPQQIDLVSTRLRGFTTHPTYRMLFQLADPP